MSTRPLQRELAPFLPTIVRVLLALAALGLADRAVADEDAYPLGLEIAVLERDLTSPEYLAVLETMIPTDLAAEWLRVASPDNYITFAAQHGGREAVLGDPKLKSAYERRKRIADGFLDLMAGAYAKKKIAPPFERDDKLEVLLATATERKVDETGGAQIPVRVLMPAPGAELHWPRLRGPDGQGVAHDASPPLHWSDTENIRWKSELPGRGNSAPVIWGNRLFTQSASEDGAERSMFCFDRNSGDRLWQRTAPPAEDKEKLYWKNTYASSTPVSDGERVIGFFGNSGLVCWDFEGKELWKKPLGPFPTMHGPGTSPVLYHDLVIVIQDQTQGDSLFVAFDKTTGEERYRHPRPNAACWSTPVLIRAGDRDELVYNGSHDVVSYEPATGNELWRLNGSSRESIPSIVVGGGLLYSTSGRNGPTLAIRPGGSGDITSTHLAWESKRGGPHVPSPTYVDGRLYIVNDTGIVTCLDAKSGKTIYQQRLTGRFSTSPIEAAGNLFLTNEEGLTFVLPATDKFKILAENDLKEDTLATPAFLGNRIYFRTASHLICIEETASK